MSSAVVTLIISASIAIFASVTAPLLLIYVTGRQKAIDRAADWARQDAVAAKAQEAADRLLIQNERVAKSTRKTQEQLDVIHTLVNSDKTAAMQREADDAEARLILLLEINRLHVAAGNEPSAESLAAIKATEQKIEALNAELEDRYRQQRAIESQLGESE